MRVLRAVAYPLAVIVFLVAFVFATLSIPGCVTPEQQAAGAALQATLDEAKADGVLTTEELAAIQAKASDLQEATGNVDWPATLGTIAGSVLATFLGIRFAPNSLIIGRQESTALNKAAGIT